MPSYLIGDVQGCYDELCALLQKIKFNPKQDKLIFAGDLVNRGPKSLEVLRLVKSFAKSAKVILGNHDLYLLAVAFGYLPLGKKDTLQQILNAPDKDELMKWLRHQRFLYSHKKHVVTHAGIPPIWSLKKAKHLALELEFVLQTDMCFQHFMSNLFGNEPNQWNNELEGINRWRCIANYFTRMRLCNAEGRLDLNFKDELMQKPNGFDAWFNFPNPKIDSEYILIFGHWAALNGKTNNPRCINLDTGCVWGGQLSAYCIDNKEFYRVDAMNLIKENH